MSERRVRLRLTRDAVRTAGNFLGVRWIRGIIGRWQTHSASGDKTARLQEFLRKKLEALNDRALKSQGEISTEEFAALERIAKSLRLSEELKPPPNRWTPVAALVPALLLVTLLLLIRVPETEVTLEIETSEFSFLLPGEKPVVGRTAVTQLGVSGLDVIRVEPAVIPELAAMQQRGVPGAIRISTASNSSPAGAINTGAIIPPAGTRGWLRHMGLPGAYRLSLKAAQEGTNIVLRADVHGRVEIAAPDVFEKPREYNFGESGGSIQFESSHDIMDMDFVLNQTASVPFYAQVPVENLAFLRIDEFATPQKSIVNPVSTVLSGTLFLESLNGEKHELRAGEQLHLKLSKGRFESLKLLEDRVALKFRGRVSGIKVGEEGTSRNLMPNLLEWLKARQPISLLWGATIFVYGLISSISSWYRKSS